MILPTPLEYTFVVKTKGYHHIYLVNPETFVLAFYDDGSTAIKKTQRIVGYTNEDLFCKERMALPIFDDLPSHWQQFSARQQSLLRDVVYETVLCYLFNLPRNPHNINKIAVREQDVKTVETNLREVQIPISNNIGNAL